MTWSSGHGSDGCSIELFHATRLACLAAALAGVLMASESATAQNRAPDEVFERAEQFEERGADTHFGPNVTDRFFDPFCRLDGNLEAACWPTFLGLYAPIWQTNSHGGPDDNMISQSVNLYGEWELLHEPGC